MFPSLASPPKISTPLSSPAAIAGTGDAEPERFGLRWQAKRAAALWRTVWTIERVTPSKAPSPLHSAGAVQERLPLQPSLGGPPRISTSLSSPVATTG